jgi:hypothetical protein
MLEYLLGLASAIEKPVRTNCCPFLSIHKIVAAGKVKNPIFNLILNQII